MFEIYFRKLVNNHTFFQHPDLIRVLRIHENVMAVMINTLGRRSQAQSDAAAQPQTAGEGETVPKKVTREFVYQLLNPWSPLIKKKHYF